MFEKFAPGATDVVLEKEDDRMAASDRYHQAREVEELESRDRQNKALEGLL
jgi:hypothetical protein